MTSIHAETDLALLNRFNDGDEEAFAEIVRRHAGMVLGVCRRVLHDAALAEDVTQETFFKLVQRHEQVSQSLAGWLHRAASRLSLDALRSESARKRREAAIAAEAEPSGADNETVVQDVRWADVSPLIDHALAELPEGARNVLVRHFLEGRSQLDLAHELNISPATMSRRMHGALDQLRAALGRRGVVAAPAAIAPLMLLAGKGAGAPSAILTAQLGKMGLMFNSAGGGPIALAPPVNIPSLEPASVPRTMPVPSRLLHPGVTRITIGAAVGIGFVLALPYLWMPSSRQPVNAPEHERSSVQQPSRAGTTAPSSSSRRL